MGPSKNHVPSSQSTNPEQIPQPSSSSSPLDSEESTNLHNSHLDIAKPTLAAATKGEDSPSQFYTGDKLRPVSPDQHSEADNVDRGPLSGPETEEDGPSRALTPNFVGPRKHRHKRISVQMDNQRSSEFGHESKIRSPRSQFSQCVPHWNMQLHVFPS